MKNLKVTEIQIFGKDEFSANIAINDKFMIQRGTDGEYSIPHPDTACWGNEDAQRFAHEEYNAADMAKELKLDKEIKKFLRP